MRLRRPKPPEGVAIVTTSGELYPCEVRFTHYENGCAIWRVIPVGWDGSPVAQMTADVLPARTGLDLNLGPDAE